MVEVEIFFEKSMEENAGIYHDKAKKSRKKLAGLDKALHNTKQRIGEARERKARQEEKAKPLKKSSKKWYERFRWFNTTEGFLVIGGRDAGSNEEVVKKYEEKNDIHFHCDQVTSPHAIIKTQGKTPSPKSLLQAASFTAIFSSAWKNKDYRVEVYSVKPEQVSKQAPTGEYLTKGAFIVRGERTWYKRLQLEAGIGVKEEKGDYTIISGPLEPIKEQSITYLALVPGDEKPSALAKKIRDQFTKKTRQAFDLDDIIRMLPPGNSKIKKK